MRHKYINGLYMTCIWGTLIVAPFATATMLYMDHVFLAIIYAGATGIALVHARELYRKNNDE
jgi:hypothetical protein